MSQKKQILQILQKIKIQVQNVLKELEGGIDSEIFIQNIIEICKIILDTKKIVPYQIYKDYQEFFDTFCNFCEQCKDLNFMKEYVGDMSSSLVLLIECIEDMGEKCTRKMKKCICCGQEVLYQPLSDYYSEMEKKFHISMNRKFETLNYKEYTCPVCGVSDRDRMILSFLKKEKLCEAAEGTKVLQIAPAEGISRWILLYCPQIIYETTDLYMEHVTFRSDLQDMSMVSDETYDVIICSHVLEHIQDDKKALSEMKRILKPDGKLIFLVPIDLNHEDIDEEWGLSETENWKRFGQGDHCRIYGKKGLLKRLKEQFYVHSLGKEYFSLEVFKQCALTGTSTLYILTKEKTVSLNMGEKIIVDETICKNGPLVSVILSCYNHEQFVAEAIESVLNQTYQNIEFLVADDASTDGTAAIMKKYSSYFTKEIYLEENTSCMIGKALESYATGKYIAIMNSDDVWESNKLALQVSYMEKHEECGACLTWCMYTNSDLEEIDDAIFLKTNRYKEEWMRYFWEYGNALCNPSSIIRSDLGVIDGMNPCWQLPDFFKWVDLVQHKEIYIIPRVLVKMRRYSNGKVENTSASTKVNNIRAQIELGSNWLNIIRRMEYDFFIQAFRDLMRNPLATTEVEIQCEKFFLLLNHSSIFVQNSAWSYLSEIYPEVEKCLYEKYHYTRKDIINDTVEKGLAKLFQI